MPLPDERPRQSVANLIGRFEQQNKRNSIGPNTPVPSFQRASSVTSQSSGDAAKVEAKEKREWPPRNAGESEAKPADSEAAKPPASLPVRKASEGITAPTPPIVTSEPSPTVSSTPKTPLDSPRAPIPPDSPPSISPPISTTTSTRSHPSVTKPKADVSSVRSPSKTPARAAPSSTKNTLSTPSKAPPVAKPLKAQLTGQSTTSNASTVRARSRAGNSTSVSTPIRPKTPSSAAASRPKTPSGLFAPTAASLAKSRNAPPVPTQTRKTSTSTNATALIDRLSKPTAASASKARSPPATPAKVVRQPTTPAARGTPATRGATLKPRVGHAPARVKAEKEKKENEQASLVEQKVNGNINVPVTTAAVAAVSGAALADASNHLEPEIEPDHLEEEAVVEDTPGTSTVTDEEEDTANDEVVESYDEDFLDDTVIHDEPVTVEDAPAKEPSAAAADGEESDAQHIAQQNGSIIRSAPETESGTGEAVADDEELLADPIKEDESDQSLPAPPAIIKSNPDVDEIESMVRMLEVTPVRPASVSDILDDAGSIPDDEE